MILHTRAKCTNVHTLATLVCVCLDMTVLCSLAIAKDKVRQDGFKLQLIFQFLQSRGLIATIAQLEEESLHVNAGIVGETTLDELADEFLKRKTSDISSTDSLICEIPPAGICATNVLSTVESIHGSANPTCVAFHPTDSDIVITGATDKQIIKRQQGKELMSKTLPSPPLCMDWADEWIVVGCMGGEVVVISAQSFAEITILKPHGINRINYVQFSSHLGNKFATCGKELSVAIYASPQWAIYATIQCKKEVASLCWISDDCLCVAETGECILTVWSIQDKKTQIVGQICMNLAIYDPRESEYTALTMAVDNTCKFLTVCTNRNSALLFSIPEKWNKDPEVPIKVLYGMSVGIYDVPSIAFSIDSSFVYVSSDKEIVVFEAKTGFKAFTINVSASRSIRNMKRHPLVDKLATVSFDKQLCIVE